ncbi:Uma2 family endonuclease [Calothrix sp. CCY 0018]|uniref:Uma2 family endonuclease n=1 Tax=Calothrix sp. CCY 0018 TaxID=3103864 RepID=UPI0039C60AF7
MLNPTVTIPQAFKVTHAQFKKLAAANRDVRLERTEEGELRIKPLFGGEAGAKNANITAQLWIWNRQTKLGIAFNSSTGFHLPNGAILSPDASWIKLERWEALTAEEKKGFAPICPDFVVELRSASDNMKPLREKMQEYIKNGAKLGWLIDRKNRKVEVYRQGFDVEILDNPVSLSGEDILTGFVLDLAEIW